MKLYATVTSERAASSQGGKWLMMEVKDEKKESILTIAMDLDGLGQWRIAKVFGTYRALYELSVRTEEGIKVELSKSKGNNQKGECAACGGGCKTNICDNTPN